MDIALIGYMNNYASMAEWVYDALIKNGHKVTKYDRLILPNIKSNHDLYFYIDCSEDYSPNIPKFEKPSVTWVMDTHMPGGIERSTNIARKCDLVISSNYNHGVKILEKFGIESHFIPITANVPTTKGKQTHDVTMIGNPNSNERLFLWDMLNKYFTSFTGIAKDQETYNAAMHGCKIVVNQPTEPWDIILNNRFFEGMVFGKLVLQKRLKCDEIERLGFKEGEHFVYWDSLNDLKEKIMYYLEHDKEREKIAKAGNVKVQGYTLDKQVEKIINLAKEL